jgi:hypothetical protein
MGTISFLSRERIIEVFVPDINQKNSHTAFFLWATSRGRSRQGSMTGNPWYLVQRRRGHTVLCANPARIAITFWSANPDILSRSTLRWIPRPRCRRASGLRANEGSRTAQDRTPRQARDSRSRSSSRDTWQQIDFPFPVRYLSPDGPPVCEPQNRPILY